MIVQLAADAAAFLFLRVNQSSGQLLQFLFGALPVGDVHDADEHRIERRIRRRELTENSTTMRSPFSFFMTVSPSNDVLPSAMAMSSPANTSRVSGANTLCSETSNSSLLDGAKQLQCRLVHVDDADQRDGAIEELRRRLEILAQIVDAVRACRSSIAALTAEKSSSQIDTPVD